jgi:KaiC/GvpD/RAD55 family RecA-like ATPase
MEEPEMRTSGVPGLDAVIGGGYRPGSRIIIYGPPTSGLDILAAQFAKATGGPYLILDEEVRNGMIPAAGLSIEDIANDIRGNTTVLDSISTVILDRGIQQATRLLTVATDVFRGKGGCLLCTFYEGLHSPIEEMQIFRQADIIIHLRSEVHQSQIERRLVILKYRGMRIPDRMIPFVITGEGIELSTTSRVV